MGKRFSESAAKVAQGRARKRQQEWEKNRAQKEQLEAMEAKKWEEGAREGTSKKALSEEKRQQKLAAKKERDASLKAEEEAIGRGAVATANTAMACWYMPGSRQYGKQLMLQNRPAKYLQGKGSVGDKAILESIQVTY